MKTSAFKAAALAATLLCLPAAGTASAHASAPPASKFDLSHWKITLPIDDDGDDKPDEISVKEIAGYSHTDYFYLDADGRMVFTAPNKAITTGNSSNTRSELRQMLRGTNTKIKTHAAGNNFAVEARKESDKFGSVGGKMEATLRVDHVARNAGNPASNPAYSVVIGQIHADKYKSTKSGFGYGNEPIKIFYKKFPGHDTGSVFWTYERNLAKDNPDRKDIAYPVFGNLWENPADPGESGIALGEDFGYIINVHRNMMYLTFSNIRHGEVTFRKSLVSQHDATGKVDEKDNSYSYGGDTLYFKAGAYNQCSMKADGSFWAAACAGTGDWPIDKANGDYTQVSFSRLIVSDSTPPEVVAAGK